MFLQKGFYKPKSSWKVNDLNGKIKSESGEYWSELNQIKEFLFTENNFKNQKNFDRLFSLLTEEEKRLLNKESNILIDVPKILGENPTAEPISHYLRQINSIVFPNLLKQYEFSRQTIRKANADTQRNIGELIKCWKQWKKTLKKAGMSEKDLSQVNQFFSAELEELLSKKIPHPEIREEFKNFSKVFFNNLGLILENVPREAKRVYNEFWGKLALVMARFELEGSELEQLEHQLDGEIFAVLEKVLIAGQTAGQKKNKLGKDNQYSQESVEKIKKWTGQGFKRMKKLIRDIHLNDFLHLVHIGEREPNQTDNYETVKFNLLKDIDEILDAVENHQGVKEPSLLLSQLEKEFADIDEIGVIRESVTASFQKRQELIRQINQVKLNASQDNLLAGQTPTTSPQSGKYYRAESLGIVFSFALESLLKDSQEVKAIYNELSLQNALTLIEELDRFRQAREIKKIYAHNPVEIFRQEEKVNSEYKRLKDTVRNYTKNYNIDIKYISWYGEQFEEVEDHSGSDQEIGFKEKQARFDFGSQEAIQNFSNQKRNQPDQSLWRDEFTATSRTVSSWTKGIRESSKLIGETSPPTSGEFLSTTGPFHDFEGYQGDRKSHKSLKNNFIFFSDSVDTHTHTQRERERERETEPPTQKF